MEKEPAMSIPKEPAVLIGFIMAVLSALTSIVAQSAGQSLSPIQWATIVFPLVAGIVTRYHVVPVDTVRSIITSAKTTGGAVIQLANVTATAIDDTPAVS